MPMTVVVTRDVESRYRGFLASAMLEVAPGVYVSPDLSSGVRERVWAVLEDWFTALGNGAVAMIWRDGTVAGGLALRHLGDPPKEIRDVLDVVQPDLLFISRERKHLLSGGENVQGAPDLVIEILSPSTADKDRGASANSTADTA